MSTPESRLAPVTVNLGEAERRFLVQRAAEESIAAGRPVSISAVARAVFGAAAKEAGATQGFLGESARQAVR
jgi:hypothetical protein